MKIKNKNLIIILLLVLSMLTISGVFAKYVSSAYGSGSMQVAKPIIQVVDNSSITIDNDNLSGTYEFSVRNYNGSEINEVKQGYDIQISINNTTYLESLSLVKVLNGVEVPQSLTNFKAGTYYLGVNDTQEDNYKLYITYSNTISEAFTENVKVKIVSFQMQPTV